MRLVVVLDCVDADALADFWSAALGFRRDSFDPPYVSTEVTRLTALGAPVLEPPHDDGGFLTVVLADPQGNEFCVITPPPRATSNRLHFWRSGAIDAEASIDDNDIFDEAGAADAAADLVAHLDAGILARRHQLDLYDASLHSTTVG